MTTAAQAPRVAVVGAAGRAGSRGIPSADGKPVANERLTDQTTTGRTGNIE